MMFAVFFLADIVFFFAALQETSVANATVIGGVDDPSRVTSFRASLDGGAFVDEATGESGDPPTEPMNEAGNKNLAAVELGVVMGARVIAAASSDDKLAMTREHGAHETINYATEDLKEALRQAKDEPITRPTRDFDLD